MQPLSDAREGQPLRGFSENLELPNGDVPHDRGPVLIIQCTRDTLTFRTVYVVLLYYVRAVSCMWINGHAWIVTHEKASRCDCSGRQSAAASILLPRATASFFSVKRFELAV
jgi:hypothetical protein